MGKLISPPPTSCIAEIYSRGGLIFSIKATFNNIPTCSAGSFFVCVCVCVFCVLLLLLFVLGGGGVSVGKLISPPIFQRRWDKVTVNNIPTTKRESLSLLLPQLLQSSSMDHLNPNPYHTCLISFMY